tara:strand:+ start:1206 stop:2318 length:1113 start_codon:yes stop_codon:yes gene_type:complete
MPIYKGTNEVTSGNLYKATTEIENAYKGTNVVYVNETTQSFAVPTGQGLTYTTPANITGSPGSAVSPTVTFTGTAAALEKISGTATLTGLPAGLTYTQSINNSDWGNVITFTIEGTYPTTSNSNIAITISGLTVTTGYNYTITASGSVGTGLTLPSTKTFVGDGSATGFNFMPYAGGTTHVSNGTYTVSAMNIGPSITVPTGISDNGSSYPWTNNNLSTNASGATGGTFNVTFAGGQESTGNIIFSPFNTASNFVQHTGTSGQFPVWYNIFTVQNTTLFDQTVGFGVSGYCSTSGGTYSFVSEWKRTDTGATSTIPVFTIAGGATVQMQAKMTIPAVATNYAKVYITVNGNQHVQTSTTCTDYGIKFTST